VRPSRGKSLLRMRDASSVLRSGGEHSFSNPHARCYGCHGCFISLSMYIPQCGASGLAIKALSVLFPAASYLFASAADPRTDTMDKDFWMQACNASFSRSRSEMEHAVYSSFSVAVSGAFGLLICCARAFMSSRGPLTRALRSRCSHLLP
jgi:hypothetical protein